VPVVVASLVGDVHVFFNLMMALCLLSYLPLALSPFSVTMPSLGEAIATDARRGRSWL
jgi:hypothetical protein